MASVVANNINNNENSNLDVQLHNSKKFVSMLQQTAWVLNNLIKNYNANYNDVNNNTKVAEQEDDKEIKQDNKKPPSNNMSIPNNSHNTCVSPCACPYSLVLVLL